MTELERVEQSIAKGVLTIERNRSIPSDGRKNAA